MTRTAHSFGPSSLVLYHDAPSWDGARTFSVGNLDIKTHADGVGLMHAVEQAAWAAGAERLLGPMDGDTWHSYRLVMESDGSAPFFMEPTSGPHDRPVLEEAGFTIIETYASARAPLKAAVGAPPLSPAPQITAWDGTNAQDRFVELYGVTRQAFVQNRFYKPAGVADFLALYQPLLPMLDPRMVLFARDETGALTGYLLAFPDASFERPTVVVKTYASLRKGVGHHLLHHIQSWALDHGFVDAIHALMHEANISATRSAQHQATVFRRYALMGKIL